MIQRAVVLCAGEGSRLRPLTFSKPKHLLPVAGKPILGWALEALHEAGVREVALIVGHHAEAIRQYVGLGDAFGLDVQYIHQLQPLGIGHAVSLARDFVKGEPFLVYLGDNLFEHGLTGFVDSLRGNDWDAALLLKSVEDPRRFGVAEVEGERILRVLEKPADPPSDLAIVGVYAFHPTVFQAIYELEPSARGEVEITDAIQQIIKSGRPVRWSKIEGLWEDAGEPTALLRANREWLLRLPSLVPASALDNSTVEGYVGIERGARAINSKLLGPCRIGRNSVIENSVIGPDVTIGSGCEISNTRVSNCVIQRNSRVRDLPGGLIDSVLGESVEVQGRPDDGDRPLSLLLSDMAHVIAR
ncbi:glucose-1-phosphate thymidylyltransferase [bacterium]|nr:glucose-1-phosphate thymidylyltransferase [bacterium]